MTTTQYLPALAAALNVGDTIAFGPGRIDVPPGDMDRFAEWDRDTITDIVRYDDGAIAAHFVGGTYLTCAPGEEVILAAA